MIIDKLINRIDELKNPTVVGLDPQIDFIPQRLIEENIKQYGETLKAAARAFYEFNTQIIDSIFDIVAAVKPQIAMYEQLGEYGIKCYIDTIAYAKKRGMIVIGDIKRSDIASTASFYSNAHIGEVNIGKNSFKPFDSDFITVNPYLGEDSITPFLSDCKLHDKGLFILVKTSNPGGGLFQNLISDGDELYKHVASFTAKTGNAFIGKYGFSSIGAVVAATYPEEIAQLRSLMPHTFFLIPGYGAQGACATDVMAAFNDKGQGAIINSSRGIIAAHKKTGLDFPASARQAALQMKYDLNYNNGRN